jgi:cyclophilin family peptidyl-prolyl cis-trans isomerase
VELTIGDAAGHVKGKVVVELFENEAPNTVANFISLVEKKFYDGLTFHRVLPEFMAQGGDPQGNGQGGPGYNIADEFKQPSHREHFRGSLSMAHSSLPNSNGSQFFICFVPRSQLDGGYTVFGRVIEGMDVVDSIQRINPDEPKGIRPDVILKAVVLRKRPHAYVPQKLP